MLLLTFGLSCFLTFAVPKFVNSLVFPVIFIFSFCVFLLFSVISAPCSLPPSPSSTTSPYPLVPLSPFHLAFFFFSHSLVFYPSLPPSHCPLPPSPCPLPLVASSLPWSHNLPPLSLFRLLIPQPILVPPLPLSPCPPSPSLPLSLVPPLSYCPFLPSPLYPLIPSPYP